MRAAAVCSCEGESDAVVLLGCHARRAHEIAQLALRLAHRRLAISLLNGAVGCYFIASVTLPGARLEALPFRAVARQAFPRWGRRAIQRG